MALLAIFVAIGIWGIFTYDAEEAAEEAWRNAQDNYNRCINRAARMSSAAVQQAGLQTCENLLFEAYERYRER